MQDQKIENLLNMALSLSPFEREMSYDLNTGYNSVDNTWEVVVRYNRDLDTLVEMGIPVTILYGGYAILELPQSMINLVASMTEIEYMEKPKNLSFASTDAKSVSCFGAIQKKTSVKEYIDGEMKSVVEFSGLTGSGTIVAAIDSGIDFSHPDFRYPDGTTRILYLWDQSIVGNPPEGYYLGTEYTSEMINEALKATTAKDRKQIVPSVDVSGHGTHVMGIAAGNGRASDGRYAGCAPNSELIVVKLGNARENAFPMTTELMQALNYIVQKSLELSRPVAINISYGNSYGSHTGSSLLETFIDDISSIWKSVICIGTGNEGTAGRHIAGKLTKETEIIELLVYEYTPSFSIQIWKNYYDNFGISITSPDGASTGEIPKIQGTNRFHLSGTEILIYYGDPTPYSINQEIYIELIPKGDFFDSGQWTIQLYPRRIIDGNYNIWLPSGAVLDTGTRFLKPTVNTSLTIPSTVRKAFAVGAYDSTTDQPAYFSGRGYTAENLLKPELVAPGVDIVAAAPGGGYTARTGTSMATPFVTGAASCLMQWGIVQGRDSYLYGEKMKAYLISGARQLPGFKDFPNSQVGWGALCVRDSIPD